MHTRLSSANHSGYAKNDGDGALPEVKRKSRETTTSLRVVHLEYRKALVISRTRTNTKITALCLANSRLSNTQQNLYLAKNMKERP